MRTHPVGDLVEPMGRHLERGQGAGPDAAGRKHRPHPTDTAVVHPRGEALDHLALARIDLAGDLRERPGHQRKITLKIVEQRELGAMDPQRCLGRESVRRGKQHRDLS